MNAMTKAELQAEPLQGLVELIHLEATKGRGPRSRAFLRVLLDELARRFGLPKSKEQMRSELNVLTAQLATRRRGAA